MPFFFLERREKQWVTSTQRIGYRSSPIPKSGSRYATNITIYPPATENPQNIVCARAGRRCAVDFCRRVWTGSRVARHDPAAGPGGAASVSDWRWRCRKLPRRHSRQAHGPVFHGMRQANLGAMPCDGLLTLRALPIEANRRQRVRNGGYHARGDRERRNHQGPYAYLQSMIYKCVGRSQLMPYRTRVATGRVHRRDPRPLSARARARPGAKHAHPVVPYPSRSRRADGGAARRIGR